MHAVNAPKLPRETYILSLLKKPCYIGRVWFPKVNWPKNINDSPTKMP
jgi:hypothetical protein